MKTTNKFPFFPAKYYSIFLGFFKSNNSLALKALWLSFLIPNGLTFRLPFQLFYFFFVLLLIVLKLIFKTHYLNTIAFIEVLDSSVSFTLFFNLFIFSSLIYIIFSSLNIIKKIIDVSLLLLGKIYFYNNLEKEINLFAKVPQSKPGKNNPLFNFLFKFFYIFIHFYIIFLIFNFIFFSIELIKITLILNNFNLSCFIFLVLMASLTIFFSLPSLAF